LKKRLHPFRRCRGFGALGKGTKEKIKEEASPGIGIFVRVGVGGGGGNWFRRASYKGGEKRPLVLTY